MAATRSLIPSDQFRELVSLRDAMDRLFEDGFIRPFDRLTLELAGKSMVAIDMYEEDDNLVVKAPVPGIKPEALNILVHGDVLTIMGEVREEKPARAQEHKASNYYLHEQHYGRFERSVRLPYPVVVERAEATLGNGIVSVTMPKSQRTPTKQIPVKVK